MRGRPEQGEAGFVPRLDYRGANQVKQVICVLWAMVALLLSGCAASQATARVSGSERAPAVGLAPREDGPVAGSFVVRSLASVDGREIWAVMLPGSSGLTVFEDDDHYFRAATDLANQGVNCLIVDYKAVYRDAGSPRLPTTATKIAFAVRHALGAARDRGLMASDGLLLLVGWSLGAEGVWEFMRRPSLWEGWSVVAAVAFYPAYDDGLPDVMASRPPTLVFVGELDDVTPAGPVVAWGHGHAATGADVSVVTLAGAHHGFDIASLPERRTVELLPVIGPRATFGYSPEADAIARERLRGFLEQCRVDAVR